MQPTPEVESAVAAINGAEIYYEIAGNGPALVLAHAGFADRRMWEPQFAVFANTYRTLRYDRRGHGDSKPTDAEFSHRDDLFALLRHLNIERAHLIGSSLGGAVALDFALEHPDRVRSLTLVSSALGGYRPPGEPPSGLRELREAIQEKDYTRAADLAVQLWVVGPRRKAEAVNASIRASIREMALTALPNIFVAETPLQPPASERLHEITAPTTVVTGELDDDEVKMLGALLASRISEASRIVVAGAAHLPNLDCPRAFNDIAGSFLGALSRI